MAKRFPKENERLAASFLVKQALSQICSYELLQGIFLSSFFCDYVNADKRTKYNISPDAVMNFPLPMLVRMPEGTYEPASFGVAFPKRLSHLKRTPADIAQPEVAFLIEQIVKKSRTADEENVKLMQNKAALDSLVDVFYRPWRDGMSNPSFSLESLIKSSLQTVDMQAISSLGGRRALPAAKPKSA